MTYNPIPARDLKRSKSRRRMLRAPNSYACQVFADRSSLPAARACVRPLASRSAFISVGVGGTGLGIGNSINACVVAGLGYAAPVGHDFSLADASNFLNLPKLRVSFQVANVEDVAISVKQQVSMAFGKHFRRERLQLDDHQLCALVSVTVFVVLPVIGVDFKSQSVDLYCFHDISLDLGYRVGLGGRELRNFKFSF